MTSLVRFYFEESFLLSKKRHWSTTLYDFHPSEEFPKKIFHPQSGFATRGTDKSAGFPLRASARHAKSKKKTGATGTDQYKSIIS